MEKFKIFVSIRGNGLPFMFKKAKEKADNDNMADKTRKSKKLFAPIINQSVMIMVAATAIKTSCLKVMPKNSFGSCSINCGTVNCIYLFFVKKDSG
jgi:hypothetical protein